MNCRVSDLSKFFFILGHIALKQLVYIEEIQTELRKRRAANEKSAQGKKKESKTAIEAELALETATEETEAETLQATAEREIVARNLLGTFGPAIALVCANLNEKFNVRKQNLNFKIRILFRTIHYAPQLY